MKSKRTILTAICALLVSLVAAAAALGGNPHGTPPGQQNTAQSQSAPGTKPSNTTGKNTECSTGGGSGTSATCTADNSNTSTNADSSKRYGNGKTAAQIANGKGAPSGTQITGPGNSQPHKICGRDVHAYGKGNSKKCGTSTASTSGSSVKSSNMQSSSSVQSSSNVQSSSTSQTSPGSTSSGVLGATATAPTAAGSTKPSSSGVLGASKTLRSSASSGTLPFTGLPLWIPALAGLLMAAGGMGLGVFRRGSAR